MVIKYLEYKAKFEHGLLPGRFMNIEHAHAIHQNLGLYFGFYFCMTGLHGIHVLAGMGVWIWMLTKALKKQFGPSYYGPVDPKSDQP